MHIKQSWAAFVCGSFVVGLSGGCASWDVPVGESGAGVVDASSRWDAGSQPGSSDDAEPSGPCDRRNVRFEFEDNTTLPGGLVGGGASPWVVAGADIGNYAQSGSITHNEESMLSLSVEFTTSTDVSFDYFTSSEASYDFLEFWIDDTLVDRWSGETFWTSVRFTVPPGRHSLRWKYTKDSSHSPGQDLVRIDNLEYSVCVG